ncbi:MAG: Uma2 family endonuclease, partial [Lachnospiraceae bacterium]|nr:Uma2 family endonuclease [Lachnospiraceae bacterium]
AIEILSPSTARLDATLKLYKYMKAGVREYWIVDPENRQVLVYRNKEGNVILKVYTFSDAVPVSIWDEKCMIDFPDIAQQIDEWSD